jgi:hypothetical protein
MAQLEQSSNQPERESDAQSVPDRALAEDDACPVDVEPGMDTATPEGWDWRLIGTSQPNRATFHVNHSDVSQVKVDILSPADSPPDAPFVVTNDIPIIIIDTLDQFWAGESRTKLPLQGLRVPVSADTEREAKQKLAADLAAQLRLLLLLSSSRQGNIAPELKANLLYLSSVLATRG